jgi:hypothetical protein
MGSSVRPIRIANTSGWAGDRKDALKRQAQSELEPDALVGDWLSEMTVPWAAQERYNDRQKDSHPASEDKYFVKSVLYAFDLAVDILAQRKQKFVTNAGSLSPKGCAEALAEIAKKHGQNHLKFAYVTGDDLIERFEELDSKEPLRHFDSDEPISTQAKGPITGVNAYIGAWPVVEALNLGADVVVTGRATDASSVIALAAWWHGWTQTQYSELAQAFICGHLLECSMYTTGGNFSGFKSILDQSTDLSFPIAEVSDDGTFVLTKNASENGIVTPQTVTSQLMYEIQGNMYICPDVQADMTDLSVKPVGKDRVQVDGVKGHPPPTTAKVALCSVGGYQAEAFVFATGLDYKLKFQMFENLARHWVKSQPDVKFTTLSFQHIGQPIPNGRTELEATATMRVFAQAEKEEDFPPNGVAALVEGLSMGTYPGFHRALDLRCTMPKLYMDYWPSRIPESSLHLQVSLLGGQPVSIPNHIDTIPAIPSDSFDTRQPFDSTKWGPNIKLPLGTIVMGRSGDKGGNANIGLFVRHADEYEWLRTYLSLATFTELLGDEAKLLTRLDRVEFPGMLAVHFLCKGLLGLGVANTDRLDGLAKSMVEFVRGRTAELPRRFVERGAI